MADDIKGLSDTARLDLIRLVLGKKLGSGMSRQVYACTLDQNFVVKVEDHYGCFQNVLEWEIWTALKDTDQARWLAPCSRISACGAVLIQRRTEPLQVKQLPKRMPVWLTDFQLANYGMLDGRVVCHDYGVTGAVVIGRGASNRLRTVQWPERISRIRVG